MQTIWHYEMLNDLTNKKAGFSLWGIGTKEGKEYFVKEFLSPKHPGGDTESSDERKKMKLAECESFENKKRKVYQAINECSDGNDVRICEFFRLGSKYYLSMERILDLEWSVEDVFSLKDSEKRRLCAIIAHSIAALHSTGVVHSDIKHENILFTKTERRTITAKVIDFDSVFFENEPPRKQKKDKVIGDQNYFPPEFYLWQDGEDVDLNCKMDVFALGVLFHQYYAGEMPLHPLGDDAGAGQAIYLGETVTLSDRLDDDIRALIARMLAPDPADRPTSQEVFLTLRPATAPAASKSGTKAIRCMRCGAALSAGGKLCPKCSGNISDSAIIRGEFFSAGQDL